MEYEPCLQNGKRPSIKRVSGPDGLEAWCVALAACLINFIFAGLGRMSGILYVAFIDIFQTDRKGASVPFSARSSTRNLLGPVVGILGEKYGVRNVTVLGGVIGTISAAICFYADSILLVTILWGGINGVGTALTTTLPQVVLGRHFKKYRTTASGMAFSGGCVGSFIFPALLEYLLHTYGLPGTFLIIAGIIAHAIPAAMILRDPTWFKSKRKSIIQAPPEDQLCTIICKFPECKETFSNSVSGDNVSEPVINLINTQLLKENSPLVKELLTKDFRTETSLVENNHNYQHSSDVQIEAEFSNILCKIENIKIIKDASTFETHSVEINSPKLVNGEIKNLKSDKIQLHIGNSIFVLLDALFKCDKSRILSYYPDNSKHISSVLDNLQHLYNLGQTCRCGGLEHSKDDTREETNIIEESSEENQNTFFVHIKTAFMLHTNPMFLLICLCRSVHFLSFVPVVTVIVDFSMDKGLRDEDGKYVIAALSLGDLLGRLCFGWLTDRGYIKVQRYMLIVMIIQGISTASLAFMESKAALVIMVAVFGLLQGSVFVRHPVLISKYLKSNEQSVGMGCMNFFSGLLGFALPSYIGYFRDTIGSYDGMFFISGGIGIFIGLLWVFEPFFVKFLTLEEEEEEEEENRNAQDSV